MIWFDYTIEQAGPNFRVKGDHPGEVMGINKDGSKKITGCINLAMCLLLMKAVGW